MISLNRKVEMGKRAEADLQKPSEDKDGEET